MIATRSRPRSASPVSGAARVNLLPPEVLESRRGRQRTTGLAVAGLALLGLLVLVYVWQGVRLAREQERLEAQRVTNAALAAEAARLAEFAQLESIAADRAALLGGLTAGEVRWSGILADVSLAIPGDVWLTSFTGSLSDIAQGAPAAPAAGAAATGAAQTAAIGEIQMAGTTFSHADVAKWLTRLDEVKEFAFPYLSLSQRGELFKRKIVQFNSSVRITEQALRRNQRGARRIP